MSGPGKRLLLVGWDSADWKLIHPLIDQGAMRGMETLVTEGVCGNLTTLEPQLSPMLWTSMVTGKHAYHHGVHGFTEVDPLSGQVVPVAASSRRCKTVWEILGDQGFRTHVIGWFATHGERHLQGKMVSNMFSHLPPAASDNPDDWPPPIPGTYWPENLGEELDQLRVSPREIDGDDMIRLFVPEAHKVDQQRDGNLWHLATRLAESYSVHAAATYLMEADPDWHFMAVYYRAIDEISHLFMPYHPPKMEGIPERDFELYKHVVTGAYRAHDLMLQRLIQLAGPDAAVVLVSDHGFHSDHLRPKFTPRVPAGITVWHRPQGVIAARGPGFKQDELIHGARLLDVAPLILTYFDLPIGRDMEGRVLREAFEKPPPVQTIATWESGDGDGPHQRGLSKSDSQALLDQFVSLGYIDDLPADPTEAAENTRRENRWNLARAYMDGGNYEEALPLLEDCYAAYPERSDHALLLGRCQLRLGLLDEAEETIDAALENFGKTESAHMIRANVALEKGDFPKALHHLEHIREQNPREPPLLAPLARTYVRLRRWEDAEATAQTLIETDPHNPHAYLILARVAMHRGDAESAAHWALEAIGFQYGNPQGHYLLGVSLLQSRDWERAKGALSNCLQLAPTVLPAYRFLAQACRALNQPEQAAQCDVQRLQWRTQLERQARERRDRIRAEFDARTAHREEERRRRREEGKGTAASIPSPPMEFILVSGLPRSGTSLMMHMLEAGGLPIMTDGVRVPDEDNPEGYWEWELIKQLPKNPRILDPAAGKVTKVISALLPHLPVKHHYRIIFMRRPVEEVVSSQWKMLERRGERPRSEADHLARTQSRHVDEMLGRLRQSDRVTLLEVDFSSLIADPSSWVTRIRAFLDDERLVSCDQMAAVVRPELYRHRTPTLLENNTKVP